MRARRLAIKARDIERARRAIVEAGYTLGDSSDPSALHVVDEHAIQAPEEVACVLVTAGAPPTHLALEQEDLEEHFLRMTSS